MLASDSQLIPVVEARHIYFLVCCVQKGLVSATLNSCNSIVNLEGWNNLNRPELFAGSVPEAQLALIPTSQ